MKSHYELLKYLPAETAFALRSMGDIYLSVDELRLRKGRPLMLCISGKLRYIDKNGRFCRREEGYVFTQDDMDVLIRSLTEYSRYRLDEEIAQGFIPFGDGMRAGVCGVCRVLSGRVVNIGEITSVNLRISRRVDNFARGLYEHILSRGLTSTLVCGAPASGKTTYLKSIIYLLSCRPFKVGVVDRRYELITHGINDLDIDAVCGCDKPYGIRLLTGVMSPDVIICDELDPSDGDAMKLCMGCGVPVIASVHASDAAEAIRRPFIKEMCDIGMFKTFVSLRREGSDFFAEVTG